MTRKAFRSNHIVAVAVAVCIAGMGMAISGMSSQAQNQSPLKQVADIPFTGEGGSVRLPELGRFSWTALYRPHERRPTRGLRHQETRSCGKPRRLSERAWGLGGS